MQEAIDKPLISTTLYSLDLPHTARIVASRDRHFTPARHRVRPWRQLIGW
jgi:hypothetical protein